MNQNARKERTGEELHVLVLRHYKENRKKCTLEPLVGHAGFHFVKFRPGMELDVDGYLLLDLDAPVLARADGPRPLLLLDSTWRYLAPMRACLRGELLERSLPSRLETAYPRRSRLTEDPVSGLASIEALYGALRILGWRDDDLLRDYHWREGFLKNCERAGI